MIRRHSAKILSIGAAAALAFGAAAAAEAQTTPTSATDTTTAVSQQRIPVTKEQGMYDTTTSTGAVTNPADTTTSPGMLNTDTTSTMDTTVTDTATGNVTTGVSSDTTTRQGITGINDTTVRADTTMRDTLSTDTSTTMMTDTLMRDTSTTMTDTTTTPNTTVPTDTSTVRTDTSTGEVVTQPTTEPDTIGMYPSRPGSGRLGRGFWIGVGGGASVPIGNLHDGGYDTGWNITVPIGWQSASTPWGLRLDLSYDRLNGSTISSAPVSVTLSDANVWSGSLDLTLQFPFGSSGSSFYLMGGGGLHHFTDVGSDNGAAIIDGTALSSSGKNSLTKAGVNGGAGLNFGFGRAKLFLESRFVSVFTEGKNSNYVPIILGVRVF